MTKPITAVAAMILEPLEMTDTGFFVPEGSPGRFGWDGAFSTSWYVDPNEQLIGVLMAQRRPDVLNLPPVVLDFWTSAYQLIDA